MEISIVLHCIDSGRVVSTFGVLFLRLFLQEKEKNDYENSKRHLRRSKGFYR